MNLPIEDWLQSQPIDPESTSNFEESFLCYKMGAYKAALLFAYLGFSGVIRERIGSAQAPKGIAPGDWAHIQSNVRNAETWDKAVFTSIQKKQPQPVFTIADDLRNQVSYWKDRRNDCAHSKANKIVSAHVEAFFAFIESNLSKFVVNGSRPAMVVRILNFYNPSITPPSADISPIIQDIPHAVALNELDSFVDELADEFDRRRNAVQLALDQESPEKHNFLAAALWLGTTDFKDACSRYLAGNIQVAAFFLRRFPQHTSALVQFPAAIRQLWHDVLFTGNQNDFPILASLLRLSLIPPDERQEAIRWICMRGTNAVPDPADEPILDQNGLYDEIERAIVVQNKLNDFDWANKSKSLVISYLSRRPISREVALKLSENFAGRGLPLPLNQVLIRVSVRSVVHAYFGDREATIFSKRESPRKGSQKGSSFN